jgi:cytochrome P450
MPYTVKGKCVYKKEDGSKVGCTKGSVNKYLGALHANANENKLVGGKADNLTLQDIANKFDVPLSDIQNQMKKGLGVEMEHTNDREKATEIVMDHLTEFPDYYDRLIKMEKEPTTEDTKSLIKRLIRENLFK